MTPRHRRRRWVGLCVLALGCAEDNDGCGTIEDCPPPCLLPEVDIELVADLAAPMRAPEWPGSGTWHFDVDLDGERFTCALRSGETDCPHPALQLVGSHLHLDRGPSLVELTVRYVDAEGRETVLLRDELEPTYALASDDPICGVCPVAAILVEVPVDEIAREGR